MHENTTIEYIFQFGLIFARLGTAFSRFPGIGASYLLTRGKLMLALSISLVLMPLIQPHLPKYTNNFSLNIGYLVLEILIGIIISLAANIYYLSLHFIGQVISMQSGLSSAAFFDPLQKSQVTLFSNFILLLTITLIFASDTHYLYIQAVLDSYHKFPLGELVNSGDLSKFVAFVVSDSFLLAFKIVSPFLIVSLALLTGSGMLARLMPNLQVFFVITPIQILIIFGVMYIVIQSVVTKLVSAIGESLTIYGGVI